MKKRYIVAIIIIIMLILVSALSFIITKNIIEDGKKYEIEKVEEYNYFVLKQNNKFGIIDNQGNILIESKYDNIIIPNPSKPIFICQEGDKNITLNEKEKEIFTKYSKVNAIRLKNIASDLMYEKSVLSFEKDGLVGLINFEGKEILKPTYASIESLPYKEGELLVKKDNKLGVINIKGNELVKSEYDQISIDNYYNEKDGYKNAGYIVGVTTNEGYRYGYVDIKGKLLLDTQYNAISRITDVSEDDNNIYLIAAKNGQYGLVKNGEDVTKNEYVEMTYNPNINLITVEKSKKIGVIDINGKNIIPIEYDQVDVNGMYMYAENNQGTTVFDTNGKEVKIDVNKAKVATDNKDYFITINNKNSETNYGVEDKNGKEIIEEKYSYIDYLFDNYFIASNHESKLGVIDSNGNEKIEIKFDAVQKITNTNLIQTTLSSGKITEIYSEKLEKICEMSNSTIEKNEKYIKIYNQNETKYFDYDGKELSNIEVFNQNNLISKEQDGKYGFIDKKNNIKVKCNYDKVTEFNKYGFAGICVNGKWGVINKEGNIVQEPIYEISTPTNLDFMGKYYKITYGFGEFYYTDAQ